MKATLWTKRSCPFCVQAKDLLASKGIEFEERVIGEGWTREQLIEAVPTAKTVPQIFLGEEYVGGYTDLRAKIG